MNRYIDTAALVLLLATGCVTEHHPAYAGGGGTGPDAALRATAAPDQAPPPARGPDATAAVVPAEVLERARWR